MSRSRNDLSRQWKVGDGGLPAGLGRSATLVRLNSWGGLVATRTLLRSYMQVDAETVRQVVLHPTQRLVSRQSS